MLMENKDNYNILGINKNANELEIKKAYKQLAKKYHPDYNKNIEAKDKFIEIQKAYEELLNPKIKSNFFSVIFGIEVWGDMIKEGDFNIPPIDIDALKEADKDVRKLKRIYDIEGKRLEDDLRKEFKAKYGKYYASSRNDRNFYEEVSKLKPHADYYNALRRSEKIVEVPYKELNWAKNKIKLLNKLYEKINLFGEMIHDIIGLDIILNHFNRLLKGEIDVKEKPTKIETFKIKPIKKIYRTFHKMDEYNDFDIKKIKKLVFDITNQFHPKFLNKFPMRIQIFLNNKIKDVIKQLSITKALKR